MSTQLFVVRMNEARTTRGRGTRKMLKWPRKPRMAMWKEREKNREKVRRIPAGERRLDLWPEM